jgi:DNA-binding XRE family transcriptional regulator
VTALRPEFDTVRDHLQAAIAEGGATAIYKGFARDEVRDEQRHYLTITAATFGGAASGHAFRAAELAYELGLSHGQAIRAGAPTAATLPAPVPTSAPPVLTVPRGPVDMALALRRARATGTLSQKRLADLCSLDPSYLSMVEGGKRVPKIEALIAIADALNMNLSTLIALGEGTAP